MTPGGRILIVGVVTTLTIGLLVIIRGSSQRERGIDAGAQGSTAARYQAGVLGKIDRVLASFAPRVAPADLVSDCPVMGTSIYILHGDVGCSLRIAAQAKMPYRSVGLSIGSGTFAVPAYTVHECQGGESPMPQVLRIEVIPGGADHPTPSCFRLVPNRGQGSPFRVPILAEGAEIRLQCLQCGSDGVSLRLQ